MIIKRFIHTENKIVISTLLRYLAGFVFIPSGLGKIQGGRFSAVFPDIPSHTFFIELSYAVFYWNFLGYCQLFIAFLLFTQRLTALSAVVYFSIALNTFLVAVSIGSASSILAAALISALGILLLAYDWCKLKSLFGFYPNFKDLRKYRSVSSKWGVIGLVTYLTTVIAVLIVDKAY